MNFIDGRLQGLDDHFNRVLGDGADPAIAPPGQCTMDPMSVLSGLQRAEVREKASAIEALTAFAGAAIGLDQEFEMPNKYTIMDEKGQPSFFVVEGTDPCTRNLGNQCTDCAAWHVDWRVINSQGEAEEAFRIERPWTCTFCCFNRPTASLTDVRTGAEVATMVDPYNCCDMTFRIHDASGEDIMHVKGGCCQWGLCCPLPCGPCSEVHFTAEDQRSGEEIGHIMKKVPSMLKFLAAPDVDNYHVDFETNDPVEKLMLMVVAVFIDFRYFSQNANAENSDGDMIPDRFDFD